MGITSSLLRIDLHVAEMWLKWATEWSGITRGLGGADIKTDQGQQVKTSFVGQVKRKLTYMHCPSREHPPAVIW
jgi:hypothetical protein